MIFYFSGGEVPSHRKILTEQSIPHVAFSYMGLRRRVRHTDLWSIAPHFAAKHILLDSGGHTLNREGVDTAKSEIEDIALEYDRFLSMRENENLGAIDRFLEFDPLVMGKEWIAERRQEPLFQAKGIAVWHEEYGVDELKRMADSYEYIAVGQGTCGDRDIVPVLRAIARAGNKLHGMGFSSPPLMLAVDWTSVSSTTWISAAQHGETFVWTGTELKRYAARYKAQARTRHRTLFESIGLDAAKIDADDPTENLKLSLWSWQAQIAQINQRHGEGVTPHAEKVDPETGESTQGVVGTIVPETRHETATPRAKKLLPGIEQEAFTHRYTDPEDGERKTRTEYRLAVTDVGVRTCDGCFLANKCPEYSPGDTCAYEIPVRVKTKEQYIALLDAIIAMQTQRVFSMRMSEEVEGGYADPNLSKEMDRLGKFIKLKSEIEEAGFSISMKIKQSGARDAAEVGLISRLFGRDAAPPAIESHPVVTAEQALNNLGVLDVEDAEIVE